MVRTHREVAVESAGCPVSVPAGDGETGVCGDVYLEVLFPDLLSFESSEAHRDVVFYSREGVVGEPEFYGAVR
jgi:hypothetical protein